MLFACFVVMGHTFIGLLCRNLSGLFDFVLGMGIIVSITSSGGSKNRKRTNVAMEKRYEQFIQLCHVL